MPIRFHCSGCQYLLQVPDDAAGKKARCPRCQNVAEVPLSSQAPEEAPTASDPSSVPASSADLDEYRLAPPDEPPTAPAWAAHQAFSPKPAASANPYQSPSYDFDELKIGSQAYLSGKPPIRPTRIVLDEVFRQTWEIYKQQLGMLLGVAVVVFGFNGVTSVVGEMLEAGLKGEDIAPFAILGFNLITWPILTFLEIGLAIVYLKIARGQPVEFSEMFSGGNYLLRSLGGDILWGLAVGLATCAFIIPGIFVALMLWPYYLFIIDRDQGVFESFSSAQQFTEGNKRTMFVVFLAGGGITLLGCLALGIGLLFAAPFVALMSIVSYLMMTGQFYRRGE